MDTDDAVGGDSATKRTTDRGNISVGDNRASRTFFNHCTAVYHMASVSEAALRIICLSVRLSLSVCPTAAPDSKTQTIETPE